LRIKYDPQTRWKTEDEKNSLSPKDGDLESCPARADQDDGMRISIMFWEIG
jgi:hypothetical protein